MISTARIPQTGHTCPRSPSMQPSVILAASFTSCPLFLSFENFRKNGNSLPHADMLWFCESTSGEVPKDFRMAKSNSHFSICFDLSREQLYLLEHLPYFTCAHLAHLQLQRSFPSLDLILPSVTIPQHPVSNARFSPSPRLGYTVRTDASQRNHFKL